MISKGRYTLARICGEGCPCRFKNHYTHLNLLRNRIDKDLPTKLPEAKYINVRGREEHETIIKDAAWCQELGLDQAYETIIYLNRWGNWLSDQ